MLNYADPITNGLKDLHRIVPVSQQISALYLPPMAQKKLQRFADIKTFSNALEYPTDMQGNWKTYFKNEHPLVLELACGRGEYAVGLAQLYPDKNFIGVDIKGNRMYIGAKKALQDNIINVAFLRTQIDKLTDYFTAGEVDEIWITFPDPQLRTSRAKRRLTHPRFLRLYQQVLKPLGTIHLKTDSPALFNFTRKVIEMYRLTLLKISTDVYAEPDIKEEIKIKTHYETLDIAQSKKIFYLSFQLSSDIPFIDVELQNFLKQTEPSLS